MKLGCLNLVGICPQRLGLSGIPIHDMSNVDTSIDIMHI